LEELQKFIISTVYIIIDNDLNTQAISKQLQ